MTSVSIGQLRDQLSEYLAKVQEGEEILVRNRELPIARIVPLGAGANSEIFEQLLAAQGHLKLPEQALAESFWALRIPRLKRQVPRGSRSRSPRRR